MLRINPISGKLDLVGDSSGFPVGYPVGSTQVFTETNGTISSQVVQINKVYGNIVKIYKKVTVDQIGIRVTSSVAGASVVGIYKYTDNGTAVGQWDLVVQTDSSTPFDTSLVANQNVLLTASTTLDVGVYAICYLSNAAHAMYQQIAVSITSFAGHAATIGTTGYKNIVSANFTYNSVMPAQLTSPIATASAYAPICVARVV